MIVMGRKDLPLLLDDLSETVKHVLVALAGSRGDLKLHTSLDDIERVHDQNLQTKLARRDERCVLVEISLVKSESA